MRLLGKQPVRYDPRTLRMERYIPKWPALPSAADWSQGRKHWGNMLNETLGDCTVAAAGHLIMNWTQNASSLVTPTDGDILGAYKAITGYREEDPSSDTGAVELNVLNYWRNVGIAGHKIAGYVKLQLDSLHLKLAIHLFGGAYTGVLLPKNFERQLDAGQDWSFDPKYPPDDNSGHAIPAIAYDQAGVTFLTWGQRQKATWEWVTACLDEAYAVLAPEWVNGPNAPNAFDLAALQNDLKLL